MSIFDILIFKSKNIVVKNTFLFFLTTFSLPCNLSLSSPPPPIQSDLETPPTAVVDLTTTQINEI
jgi:hypothetical protein